MKQKAHHTHLAGIGGATPAGSGACRRQAGGATGREGCRAVKAKLHTQGTV